MKKRIISIISSIAIMSTFIPTVSAVKMYSPDGRTASVMDADVAAWKAKGWSTKNYKTMYAADGRSEKVLLTDVAAWKKVGWYENETDAKLGFSADDNFYESLTNTILEEAEKNDMVEEISRIRFDVGYVNSDNIPDVFISGGTGTGAGVGIFIIKNGKAKKVTHEDKDAFLTDNFGQNGRIEYIPKKNRIFAEYGGTGWSPTFFDISNYKGIETHGLSAWHEQYSVNGKRVTQLEFYDTFNTYYNDGVEYEKVDYENMHQLSKENMKKYYSELVESTDLNKVKVYSVDGKTADVKKSDVESWKKVGWYDEPVRTMYTMDGKSKVISAKDITAWVKVGWHATESLQMFAPEQDSCMVALKDVEAWKKVGWYDYPVMTVYSKDGKSRVIAEEYQAEYREKGWYSKYETTTLYAADGRSEEVPIKDVVSWKKVGWYEVSVTTVYASDGRSQVIAKSDVEAWKKVGWYLSTDKVTMFGSHGEIENVPIKDVAAWKKVGWTTDYNLEVCVYDDTRSKGWMEHFTLSDILSSGYNYSIGDASEMAINYCKIYLPYSWEYVLTYGADMIEERGITQEKFEQHLYGRVCLVDYDHSNYTFQIDSVDWFEYVSVNKFTGDIKHIGGGHEYIRHLSQGF